MTEYKERCIPTSSYNSHASEIKIASDTDKRNVLAAGTGGALGVAGAAVQHKMGVSGAIKATESMWDPVEKANDYILRGGEEIATGKMPKHPGQLAYEASHMGKGTKMLGLGLAGAGAGYLAAKYINKYREKSASDNSNMAYGAGISAGLGGLAGAGVHHIESSRFSKIDPGNTGFTKLVNKERVMQGLAPKKSRQAIAFEAKRMGLGKKALIGAAAGLGVGYLGSQIFGSKDSSNKTASIDESFDASAQEYLSEPMHKPSGADSAFRVGVGALIGGGIAGRAAHNMFLHGTSPRGAAGIAALGLAGGAAAGGLLARHNKSQYNDYLEDPADYTRNKLDNVRLAARTREGKIDFLDRADGITTPTMLGAASGLLAGSAVDLARRSYHIKHLNLNVPKDQMFKDLEKTFRNGKAIGMGVGALAGAGVAAKYIMDRKREKALAASPEYIKQASVYAEQAAADYDFSPAEEAYINTPEHRPNSFDRNVGTAMNVGLLGSIGSSMGALYGSGSLKHDVTQGALLGAGAGLAISYLADRRKRREYRERQETGAYKTERELAARLYRKLPGGKMFIKKENVLPAVLVGAGTGALTGHLINSNIQLAQLRTGGGIHGKESLALGAALGAAAGYKMYKDRQEEIRRGL